MLISELSELTGCNAHQLRYYEKQGLLAPQRGINGYRHYSADAVQVVESIRALLTFGLSTGEIGQVLPSSANHEDVDSWAALSPILHSRLHMIDQQIDDLRSARRLLLECLAQTGHVADEQ